MTPLSESKGSELADLQTWVEMSDTAAFDSRERRGGIIRWTQVTTRPCVSAPHFGVRPYRGLMWRLWALTASALVLTGCGVSIPSDPHGTLADASGGTLRVGVAPNEHFTNVEDGRVSGSEAELVEAFAETIDADVAWTVGSEEALVRALERHDIDLVIAGLTDASPWVARTGMTRPYGEFTDEGGKTHKLVMLVPMGENAFLVELETFLSQEAGASS